MNNPNCMQDDAKCRACVAAYKASKAAGKDYHFSCAVRCPVAGCDFWGSNEELRKHVQADAECVHDVVREKIEAYLKAQEAPRQVLKRFGRDWRFQ